MVAGAQVAFPPVNSGGLIEAERYKSLIPSTFEFPPVNSGGLIEAPMWYHRASTGSCRFRR